MIEFNLEEGLKGIAQMTVNEENSAERFAKPMPPAFATPMLVSLMDLAAINAVKKNLPEGYISVATKISITHLAATPLGMTVTADATLIDMLDIFPPRCLSGTEGANIIEELKPSKDDTADFFRPI